MPIYDDIKAALIKHGWAIDTTATERPDGEVREFVHPKQVAVSPTSTPFKRRWT